MYGFLRGFYSLPTLSESHAFWVATSAARKAIELAMLGLPDESQSILTILAQHSDSTGPLISRIPNEAQFLYELTEYTPDGVERADEDGLNRLEAELVRQISYLPEEVNVFNGEEKDYQKLKDWYESVKEKNVTGTEYTRPRYYEPHLCSGLTGLLILALHLNKTSEADEIMASITDRIQVRSQSLCLALVRQAWKRYFLSGWLQERLGVDKNELKEYARYVCEITRKRLEEGVLKATNVFRDHSMKEMLDELDRNTVGAVVSEEYFEIASAHYEDNDDEGNEHVRTARHSHPSTILRKPATPDQIAEAETTVGRPLPDDLKEFYSLTNGTRPVIQEPWPPMPELRLKSVQSLYWEEEAGYALVLLAEAKQPRAVDWPGTYGGIAMYEYCGQRTKYLWHLTEESVGKAKKVLDDAYKEAEETERQALDELVNLHYGSWEGLKNLKTCWFHQLWGEPEGTVVYPDFKAFLSEVVLKSRVEEDKSPLRASREEFY